MAHPGIEAVRELLGDRPRPVEMPTVQERRAMLEALSAAPAPEGVTVETTTLGGRPAERTTPERVDGPGVVLYLHGGGYVGGTLSTHRALVGRLALATARPVVSLDYRLGPEDPFPAAVDDAIAALEQLSRGGYGPVALAGDSAGGGLALATLVAVRDRPTGPEPAAAWLISPWADLTQSGDSHDSRADDDPMLSREVLADMAGHYLAGHDPADPLASPLLTDLSGLPPIRVDVGDAEVLLDDAAGIGRRVTDAGGEAETIVWPEMIHVFPAFPAELVPESDECLAAAAEFLTHHLG